MNILLLLLLLLILLFVIIIIMRLKGRQGLVGGWNKKKQDHQINHRGICRGQIIYSV